jgi:hypothetical protein
MQEINLPGWTAKEELMALNDYKKAIEIASGMQYMRIKAVWNCGSSWKLFFRDNKTGRWSEESRNWINLSQLHVDVVISGDSYSQPDGAGGACSHEEFVKRIPMAISFWDWNSEIEKSEVA